MKSERDVTKAHWYLYIKVRMLHRNISLNYIVVTKAAMANGFKGMLIDLDLGKIPGSEESGAPHRTGTVPFMTVEVLIQVEQKRRTL